MQYIQMGGWVMYLIVGCSVIALGLVIERLLIFYYAECNMAIWFPNFEALIRSGKYQEAISYCESSRALIPKLLAVGVRHRSESNEDIRQILIDEIQVHILPTLQRNLNFIATIGKISPMLGLLGTVVGMVSMFMRIKDVGLGNPQAVSEDIAFALITTVGGLLVLIPLLLVQAYFNNRIRAFEREIFYYTSRFLREIRKRPDLAKSKE